MALTRSFVWLLVSVLLSFTRTVGGLASTDTITWGGDNGRSSYQTNHNMDPAIVGSSSFGQIFKTFLPGNFNGIGAEQIFSQPLVYTGADGVQYIYVATTQNNIYKLNAKTGAIVAKRNLWVPFLTADLDGCVDINPTVGVTATGVIDPATSIWYFTAKTYSSNYQGGSFGPNNPPGRLNGRYYFHAINTADLTDAFAPTPLEGTIFRNNANRMFISGNQHQRPALLQVDNYIYAGFASHCVKWNFTGAILGFNKNTGSIVEAFATEGGPEANTIPGGGVWMSGGGLAYDGKGSMYFATGNGYASQLPATGMSVPGRTPPTALEEAAVNAKINDDGTISIIDFFMPWEKTQLDGADKDLGTSPLEILPSDTFSCPNHKRIGVVTGKSGKTYWLNLDDLGGYQNGDNKQDKVIQVYQNENSVYAGAGVMPLGGGYIYINVIQYPTHVFKFSCNSQGNAVFTKVADTAEKCAYVLGVGHGTTTSLNGQDGTGLLWVSDVEGLNLRIYNAIPPSSGGNLTLVNSFNIPGVTKFTRPVFGDGRAYIGTTQGYLYGFGSPVSLPLNCSSPYTFPKTALGNTSTPVTVTCVANVATTINSLALTGNPNYVLSNLPSTPLQVAQGGKFSFNAVFTPKSVGLLSSDVVVNTTNGATGYSTSTPITLKGQSNSAKPLLAVRPNTISFNTIAGSGTDSQTVIFANDGDALLTFQNISYSQTSETGPWVTPNTTSNNSVQVGPFTFVNVPTSIAGNSIAPVTINYNPQVASNDAVFIKAFSDGGNSILDIVGVAGSVPVALFEFQTPDGTGWVQYVPGQNFTFGNVTENTTRNLKFRITNNGSSTAAPLSITVSKPPYGVPGILGAANNVDLGEGTSIPAGQNQTATLYCSPPKQQVNTPGYTQTVQWTINTGDLALGKQFINFVCNAVSEQVGPLYGNGTARYGYVGCARDNNPGRQLATQIYADNNNNTNDRCTSACYAAGWLFAGTQYNSQCWCGNAIPIQFGTEADCNYQCTGNTRQACGGNGQYNNGTFISLFADSSKFNGNKTSPPLQIPQTYGSYSYNGCYAESGGKALTAKGTNSQSMTVENCGAFCAPGGYKYFAVEYGVECYCGNTISNGASNTSDSQCNMNCGGSNSEYCGAGNRAQVYMLNSTLASSTSTTVASTATPATGTVTTSSAAATSTAPAPPATIGSYVYQSCYTEIQGRALQSKNKAAAGMTNNVCATFCAGYTYFATEYGQECYCGNTVAAGSAPATDGRCNMLCSGDSTQICGGPNGLTLYTLNSSIVSSSSSSIISSTSTVSTLSSSASLISTTTVATSTTSTTPTPTGPVVVPSASGYASLGCYNEVNGRRALSTLYANDSMTIEMCAAQASAKKAVYFGVEYGRECWFGTSLDASSLPIAQSKCNMLCPGNAFEYCGGGNALQMYNLSAVSTTSTSTTTTTTSTSTTLPPTSTSSTVITTTSSSSAATSTVVATTTTTTTTTTSSAATSTVPTSTTIATSVSSSIASSTSSIASSTSSTASSSSSTAVTLSSISSSIASSITSMTSTTLATSTTTSTTSTTTFVQPSQTPLICPDSNNTVWWAPSGAKFLIECDIDHAGGDINMTYVNTYEQCITACDNQKNCVDVSLSGTACYMKGKLGNALNAKGIRGAKLLPNTTSSTTSMTATPTPVKRSFWL